MQLTRLLMYYVRRRHVPGRLDTGKHRVVKRMTPARKLKAMTQMVAEQHNIDTLDRPYLTEEEDQFHEMQMAAKAEEDKVKAIAERRQKNWWESRTMESELTHLNVNKVWE